MNIRGAILIIALGAFSSCRSANMENGQLPIELMPMYGGLHNPTVQQNKDFSASAAKLGWKYYYSGDMDTAMKRFNQSWMFNRENADAYWGFGLITGWRGKKCDTEKNFKEAIRFLEMACKLDASNAKITVDLACSHTLLGYFYKENGNPNADSEFGKSKDLLHQAEKADPGYPLVYSNQSVLCFYKGDYSKAKELLSKAERLGFKPDVGYVEDLENKLKSGK